MDRLNNISRYKELREQIGKQALHSLYPNDFEFYMVALELTTFGGDMIDYFAFPIMPKSITKTEAHRVNVKSSASSVNVLMSKANIPSEISLKGDFGRNFKILIDVNHQHTLKAFKFSFKAGVRNVDDLSTGGVKQLTDTFDPIVKTGYGCIKMLQSIIDKARGTDETGRPFKLYFYNPALGESYLVAPTVNPLSFMQNDSSNNMIWAYTLNLHVLSKISGNKAITLKNSTTNILAASTISKGVTSRASDLKLLYF